MVLIEFSLWICVIIILFISFGLFLLKALKEESKISKQFFFTVSFFFLCIGIQRCLSLLFDFFYPSLFILFLISLFMLISAVPFLYHLENSVIKSKRILSLATLVMIAVYVMIYLLFGYDRILMVYYYAPPFILGIGSVAAIYLYLIIKGSGKVRKNATLIMIGLVNLFVFWFIHGQFGRAAPIPATDFVDIIGILSPIGIIVGLCFLDLGFLKRGQ